MMENAQGLPGRASHRPRSSRPPSRRPRSSSPRSRSCSRRSSRSSRRATSVATRSSKAQGDRRQGARGDREARRGCGQGADRRPRAHPPHVQGRRREDVTGAPGRSPFERGLRDRRKQRDFRDERPPDEKPGGEDQDAESSVEDRPTVAPPFDPVEFAKGVLGGRPSPARGIAAMKTPPGGLAAPSPDALPSPPAAPRRAAGRRSASAGR